MNWNELSGRILPYSRGEPFCTVFENQRKSLIHVKQYYPIGQKLVENAKIENLKRDIFINFQTMWWLLFYVD